MTTERNDPLRVLVVEDEPSIAKPLRRALEREGFLVAVAETGGAAIDVGCGWRPDAILLDLGLPDMDGRTVAREIRRTSSVPILMVTARAAEADRVEGLDIGADDYVVKPYSVPELMARVRAAVRRRILVPDTDGELRFKDVRLDLTTFRAFRGDDEIQLTNKELEILRMLMARPGAVVRRDVLIRSVWNISPAEGGNTLDVHVSSLRKKLADDPRRPRYIETVRAIGFRLAS